MTRVHAFAPGRVNLIGDHTDYMDGLVLPMAIELGTTVEGQRANDRVVLRSATEPDVADIALDVDAPASVLPRWARFVAAVISELRPTQGFDGTVTTTLPVGSGLSSSTALTVAVAVALGADPRDARALAQQCQRAEQAASGIPCGVMDQLASVAGVEGHALLIDCASLDVTPVPLPTGAVIVIAHSGQPRILADTAYAERRAACERAAELVGPLRDASLTAVEGLEDETLRRRARHVVTENERVRQLADALRAGELADAGALMNESHESLRDDFEVSSPALDRLVERLRAVPGIVGARLTGAGFGGCAVALATRDDIDVGDGWIVRASAGARLHIA